MQTDHSDDSSGGQPHETARAATASFVIDTASAAVIAANEAGRALWGMARHAEVIAEPLDRAMPALRALSAVAAQDARVSDIAALTFWRPNGTMHGRFRLRRLSATTVEVTEILPERPHADSGDGAAAAPARLRVADPATQAPSPRRGDLDTLREIARRIREARCPTRAPADQNRRPSGDATLPVIAVADDGPPEMPAREPVARTGTSQAGATPPGGPRASAPPPPAVVPDTRAVLERIVADAALLLKACEDRDGAISHGLHTHVGALHTAAQTALEHANLGPAAPRTFTEIDLEQMFEACRTRATTALDAKGIRVTPSIGRRLPHVISDSAALTTLCDGLIAAALELEPSDGLLSLAARHALDGPVVIAVSFRPSAGAFTRFEPRLAALRSLARSIGCTLDGETSPTGLLNLRLEIPKSHLIPV